MLFSLRINCPRLWYETSLASSASLSLRLKHELLVGGEINCSQVEVWHVVERLKSAVSQDENLEVFTLFDGLFDIRSEFSNVYLGEVEFD